METTAGKNVKKRTLSSTLAGTRLVLRANIFQQTLQICKADLSFCGEMSLAKDFKHLANLQASFIFYSYTNFNADAHCDTKKEPYNCIPSKPGKLSADLQQLC